MRTGDILLPSNLSCNVVHICIICAWSASPIVLKSNTWQYKERVPSICTLCCSAACLVTCHGSLAGGLP